MNKKGLFLCLVIPVAYSLQVSGQGEVAMLNKNFSNFNHLYEENGNNFTSNVFLNEISTRAYKHFGTHFPFAVNEVWKKTSAGYVVSFTTPDSTLYHVYYDLKGRFLDALSYYNNENIPADIKQSVDRLYKGYAILIGSAIDDGVKTIYNVSIVRDYAVKVVEFSGSEVRTINQYQSLP